VLARSDDDVVPLDKYVFNTEAHPLKIWKDENGPIMPEAAKVATS
jgi:hypothetical protein